MCSAILMNAKVDSYVGKLLSLFKKSLSLLLVAPKGHLENKGEQHNECLIKPLWRSSIMYSQRMAYGLCQCRTASVACMLMQCLLVSNVVERKHDNALSATFSSCLQSKKRCIFLQKASIMIKWTETLFHTRRGILFTESSRK